MVQKRALSKKINPGKWAAPSAGHVDAGETLLEACVRETFEELGIKAKQKDFVFLKEWLIEKDFEFAENFLLKTNKSIAEMTLQKEEVECVKWLDYDEFVKLLYSENFCELPMAFKDWLVKILKS